MKLTRRQETFFHQLLDLYRESQGPIHYRALAERLGVSPFTAYDMLRLLEEKGLAAAEHRVAPDKTGPGRAEVVFRPTERARREMEALGVAGPDWEAAKRRLVEKISRGAGDPELLAALLARVPDAGAAEPEPVRYCAEVLGVAALRLRPAGRRRLREYWPELVRDPEHATAADLALLGGFVLGLLAGERGGDALWSRELVEHVRRYQDTVARLDPALVRQLSRALTRLLGRSN